MLQALSLVRDVCRRPGDPLNILLVRSSDQFDVRLCRSLQDSVFYAPALAGVSPWDSATTTPPHNLVLLAGDEVPSWVGFDLVVAPFRPAVIAPARALSARLQVPLVHLLLEAPGDLSPGRLAKLKERVGHHVVVPDDKTAAAWGLTSFVKARAWTEPSLATALRSCVGGPYEMRWGFDG